MCLAERQTTLSQVIGNIGGGKVPHAALARHGILVDGPGRNHSGHNGQALHERMGGIERTLLVLLQVLVISERQALHGHEQLHQVAIDSAALTADELSKIGILLLRHDGRTGGVGVGKRDKAKFGTRPQHDFLGKTRQMHRHDGAGVMQIEQEITVGNRIERVGNHACKTKFCSRHLTIERIARTGKRGSTQRAVVSGIKGGLQAYKVTRKHPGIRQQMMREQHGLSVLHMRIARQNHLVVLLGRIHQYMAQLKIGLHELLGQCLDAQARVGRHLVVARTSGMQALASLADATRQLALDRHMDILVVDIEAEVAGIDIPLDSGQALGNRLLVLDADDAPGGQHLGMRLRAGDILLIEMFVDRQRRAKLLRDLGHACLKTTAPKSHGIVPFHQIPNQAPNEMRHVAKAIYQPLVLHIPHCVRGHVANLQRSDAPGTWRPSIPASRCSPSRQSMPSGSSGPPRPLQHRTRARGRAKYSR